MIQTIAQHSKLSRFTSHKIEDAGIGVDVENRLTQKEYIGVKVDDYYMSLKLRGETPKAVDFIVTVDCQCNAYVLYIIEFKNTNSPQGYTSKDICDKFDTAINRFMAKEFKDVFQNDRFKYKDMKLYLVTSAYKEAVRYGSFQKYIEMRSKVNQKDTLVNDMTLSGRIFCFRGMARRIEREIPPNPVISRLL